MGIRYQLTLNLLSPIGASAYGTPSNEKKERPFRDLAVLPWILPKFGIVTTGVWEKTPEMRPRTRSSTIVETKTPKLDLEFYYIKGQSLIDKLCHSRDNLFSKIGRDSQNLVRPSWICPRKI